MAGASRRDCDVSDGDLKRLLLKGLSRIDHVGPGNGIKYSDIVSIPTCPILRCSVCLQIAYILSVNANILSDTGGPCTSADCTVSDSHTQIQKLVLVNMQKHSSTTICKAGFFELQPVILLTDA